MNTDKAGDNPDHATPHNSCMHSMKDLTNPRWIKLKGILFLIIGLFSSVLLLVDQPGTKTVILLGLAVWGFCRFYYFAFYVIEHYVDPGYRFSGLWSFAKYLVQSPRKRDTE